MKTKEKEKQQQVKQDKTEDKKQAKKQQQTKPEKQEKGGEKQEKKKFVDSEVECSCGAIFYFQSCRDKMNIEICSQCHPVYVGKNKIIDTMGRVKRFQERLAGQKTLQVKLKQDKNKQPQQLIIDNQQLTTDN
jgi:large subunit ribosomal protein L31